MASSQDNTGDLRTIGHCEPAAATSLYLPPSLPLLLSSPLFSLPISVLPYLPLLPPSITHSLSPSPLLSSSLTHEAEVHREEDEAVRCSNDDHGHVHSEVVDLKQLRLGKEEYEHS